MDPYAQGPLLSLPLDGNDNRYDSNQARFILEGTLKLYSRNFPHLDT